MAGKKKRGKKKKGFPQASNLPSGGAPNSPESSTESPPSFTTPQPSEATSSSATTQQATDSSPQNPLSDCSAQSTSGEAIADASAASGGAQSLHEMKRRINESSLSPVEQGRLLVLLLSEKAQRDVMELSRSTNPNNWMEAMQAYIAASFAPSGEEINTLKEKVSTLEVDVADVKIFKKLMAEVFAYDEEAASVATVPEFKRGLIAEYSRELNSKWGDPVIYCMMTQAYLPRKYVISSHLWKRAWHKHTKELMGFDHIHDVRNGLLLFKPIEWAFDTSQLCFIPGDFGVCAWILNPDILETRLVDYWLEKECQDGREVPQSMVDTVTEQIGNMCFEDLHGWSLHSDGPSSPRPYQRVLYYQARMACRHAMEQGWAESRGLPQIPSIKSADFTAERKDRLDRFFASIEAEGAAD